MDGAGEGAEDGAAVGCVDGAGVGIGESNSFAWSAPLNCLNSSCEWRCLISRNWRCLASAFCDGVASVQKRAGSGVGACIP